MEGGKNDMVERIEEGGFIVSLQPYFDMLCFAFSFVELVTACFTFAKPVWDGLDNSLDSGLLIGRSAEIVERFVGVGRRWRAR